MAENKLQQVLQIDPPRELVFTGPFTDVVNSTLKLKNPSERSVCFKVKTTNPGQYCVRPNSGIIPPGQNRRITVMLQPLDGANTAEIGRHKFMVQTCFAPPGEIDLESLWKTLDQNELMYSKLIAMFENPRTTTANQFATSPTTFRDISQPDFTTKWGNRCDIAIKTQNSETLLYANKSILAVHSPFFEALFFGGFKESNQDTVEVNVDFEAFLEILKVLHNVGRNCRFLERKFYCIRLAVGTLDNKVYSATELVALYRAAELLDISLIRELCQQHNGQIPIKDAFEIILELGLHKEKSEILKKMSYADINQILSNRSEELAFSPADTAIIVEKSKQKVSKQLD